MSGDKSGVGLKGQNKEKGPINTCPFNTCLFCDFSVNNVYL